MWVFTSFVVLPQTRAQAPEGADLCVFCLEPFMKTPWQKGPDGRCYGHKERKQNYLILGACDSRVVDLLVTSLFGQ